MDIISYLHPHPVLGTMKQVGKYLELSGGGVFTHSCCFCFGTLHIF